MRPIFIVPQESKPPAARYAEEDENQRAAKLTFGNSGHSFDERAMGADDRRGNRAAGNSSKSRARPCSTGDQDIYAQLHYLGVPSGSGTAFYRHRATRIERVTNSNAGFYVAAASLLHSGIIPEGMSFSADRGQGRLTANFFLKGR